MKEEQINNILKSVLNVSDDDISKNLGIHDVDNWDSLTHMSLIVEIENNFKQLLKSLKSSFLNSIDLSKSIFSSRETTVNLASRFSNL